MMAPLDTPLHGRNSTPHLLAIDVGTLSARAGLFDAEGRLIAARSASVNPTGEQTKRPPPDNRMTVMRVG